MDASKAARSFGYLALFLATAVQGLCEKGWYGVKCDKKCHCPKNELCQITGKCQPKESCEDGYFGPSCQYVNLLYKEGLPSNPRFLKDFDERTCNPDTDSRAVTIRLRKAFRLTWLRLLVSDPNMHLEDLHMLLNGKDNACPTFKWAKVNKVMDINCNTSILVQNLTIQAPLAARLCDVYFSGGRNIALKQSVKLSSTDSEGDAEFSVDGEFANSSGFALCSHTGVQFGVGTWKLFFSKEHAIYRVRIFTLPEFAHRLAGLSAQIHNSNMTVLETHTAPGVSTNTLDFNFMSKALVTYLTLQAGNVAGITDGRLSVCEVEVFGDLICNKGVYSLTCAIPCTCKNYEVCYSITGGCMTGCPHGLFGLECDKKCPPNCLSGSCSAATGSCYLCPEEMHGTKCEKTCPPTCFNSSCSSLTGKCYRCPIGYQGFNCTEKCKTGRFGTGCSQVCSPRCAGYDCNHIRGHCERCPTGRGGPACDECPHGTYGNNCSGICPVGCNTSNCDRVSGTCYACGPNFEGIRCSDCITGKYGDKCTHDCSHRCNKRICDQLGGHCLRCSSGYHGPRCEATKKVEEDNISSVWVLFVFAVFPLAYTVVGFYKHCVKKKAERDQRPSQGSDASFDD